MTEMMVTLQPGPVLLFGGPYGNLGATRAIRAVAASRGIPPDNCVCTGDIVAYCAHPAATVALIRDWGIPVVMGNCEESLGADATDCGCGFEAGSACAVLSEGWYAFARQRVGAEERAWMRALPRAITFELQGRRFRVVHGGVRRINRFLFPSTPAAEKAAELAAADADVVIGGHSGIPFGERVGGRAWLNAGVIGLPANDGTRDGWYMVLEAGVSGPLATWHRLVYDAEPEARAMHEAGLDNGYATALLSGRWPSLDVLPPAEQARQGQPLAPPPLLP